MFLPLLCVANVSNDHRSQARLETSKSNSIICVETEDMALGLMHNDPPAENSLMQQKQKNRFLIGHKCTNRNLDTI